jgi:hypothetical protein
MDMLDGRIARFTSTGSEFGEQLDSLVDAISFGVAPALIVYFLFLGDGVWSWTSPSSTSRPPSSGWRASTWSRPASPRRTSTAFPPPRRG